MKRISSLLFLLVLLCVTAHKFEKKGKKDFQLEKKIKDLLDIEQEVIVIEPVIKDTYILQNDPVKNEIEHKPKLRKPKTPKEKPHQVLHKKPQVKKDKFTPYEDLVKEMKEIQDKYQYYIDLREEFNKQILISNVAGIKQHAEDMFILHDVDSRELKSKMYPYLNQEKFKEPYETFLNKYILFREVLAKTYEFYFNNQGVSSTGNNPMDSQPIIFTNLINEENQVRELVVKIKELITSLTLVKDREVFIQDAKNTNNLQVITDYFNLMKDLQTASVKIDSIVKNEKEVDDIAPLYPQLSSAYKDFRKIYEDTFNYYYEKRGAILGIANNIQNETNCFE